MNNSVEQEILEQINLESDRYYNLAKDFREKWIREKRCKCCGHPFIISGKCVLTCHHYRKALNEYTKELQKSLDQKTMALVAINLYKFVSSGETEK